MNAQTPVFRHLRSMLCGALLLPALGLPDHTAWAQGFTLPQQLIDVTQGFLERSVSDYLARTAIEARHEVSVNRLDPRLRLASCDEPLTTELESPAQPVGRVTVRVSCQGSSPWAIFVPGQIRLYRDVMVAARPLKRQERLSPTDVTLAERDVGLLTQGYLTGFDQILGHKLTRSLMPDQALTPAHVEMAEVVRKGDQVVISAQSGTINVRMPGEALTDGAPGQQIRVRNQSSGRIVKARVTGPGQVTVAM